MSKIKSDKSSSILVAWKMRIYLCILSAVTDVVCRPNGTINRRLLNLLEVPVKIHPNKIAMKGGVKASDISIDPSRNLWFRVFTPTADDITHLPVIVFFHGGGFALLSPDFREYHFFCRHMAQNIPAVVVSVNYRLAPEYRFPSQYQDGFDALKFLDQSTLIQADLSRCFLAGDSAGGNLAHHVACQAGDWEFRVVRVIGLISIQPFFGGQERTESEIRLPKAQLVSLEHMDWMWKAFLPEDDGSNRDHEAVNVTGPNAMDISGVNYPTTLVFVGGLDPLQDRQRRYYEWLKTSGKEAYLIHYPNAIHAFYWFSTLPEFSMFITEVRDFIQNRSNP